ncbi:hypothetical protein A3J19_00440 [Candidatus Daviesbacteria bacterium RIFCSPLOWO2_02_FULL_41_8]|uniref:Uncharacterized protein n=3 Tax=Candidatus Daviesiibacteriota TaxID=1752718 RepID=A0A1F5NGS2_9BACT|nr:MAG: hypothetical protein A2871_02785 [Candidatus Daviesbacteria bacterium RIFCSPHIGHO2_01_FULL_41_23]OGE33836.1 MAG: hypothetical protein A3D83_04660 [Candidatus Daviesbacteria bacterium RIFCSPHIGHO2_02_FULL_41_10]OGE62103.1 MAG: hypothetical protein A2967_00400 [Candidatus Daviesbacteria bacterium RIFCSPLOWO2_01_FULL_41_32]OGE76869.1 MAG: hypothetical protein A3J19_00440 [Candidatus Daviesbacteria bacterium RIFCSPLOWO2_02_FULL_41_8]
MLTSKDIKLLIGSFKTREEADADSQALKEEMQELRLDVLEKLDAVYKEVKDMRQEQDMHVQKHRDIDERLDNLESPIHSN